jgi:hypothetical protein
MRRWTLGILAGIILSIFSVYPQYHLQQLRGESFEGAFASCDLDEMAYASYLQALIDGRPRKNDPYTGRDSTAEHPQKESLFSIQFLPNYLSAVPARLLHLSASQMMPVVSVVSAFFTTLMLFWLFTAFTDDDLLSFAGTLAVMSGAALVTGIGVINEFFDGGVAYPFFPSLRRPIPSMAFPFLFAFLAFVWKGLDAVPSRRRTIFAAASGICFAALVFSYFYLWTSAAAILGGMAFFALVLPSENKWKNLRFLGEAGGFCVVSLLPYAWLLSGRNKLADKAQLLVFTHRPDLFRTVEIIGAVVMIVVLAAVLMKMTRLTGQKAAYIMGLALSPVLVFNQQLLTGRSLQPFHYEFYVINYVVLLACILMLTVLWLRFISRVEWLSAGLAIVCALAAATWGYFEATETTVFWDDVNVQRDDAMPVNLRLRELADGKIGAARSETTINLESLQADSQPTVAPQPVLWARHQHTFAGLESWDENKLRYYQLLYFADLDAAWLKRALTGCADIEACMALFGWDRFNARLSADARPLTAPEIDEEVKNFEQFSANFGPASLGDVKLSYVVAFADAGDQFVNIDRWYERDSGEQLGKYLLYKLKPRR